MKVRPRPLPDPLVDCPWCASPVELGAAGVLRCSGCGVSVAVTEPRPVRRRDRAALVA